MTFTRKTRSKDSSTEFWIALGADGREGGLFVSRDEALKFAQSRLRGHGVAKNAPMPLNLWKSRPT